MKNAGGMNRGTPNNVASGTDCGARIAVMGAPGVGKSALVVRYLTGRFIWEYDPTLECTYKQQIMVDDESATIEILDTAGQSLDSYNSCHVEGQVHWAEAFILVYSVTDRHSMEVVRALKQLVDDVKAPRAPYSCLVLGNKSDLEAGRKVSTTEGEELAGELGCGFTETSAAAPQDFSQLEEAVHDVYRDVRRRKMMETLLNNNKASSSSSSLPAPGPSGGGGGGPGSRRRSSVHQRVSSVFNSMITKIQNG